VSLPLIAPALLFSAVLVFFGIELFGLPLVSAIRRPPGAVDVPVQADEQARHAVVSPDGGCRRLHRRDDDPARAAAAAPLQNARRYATIMAVAASATRRSAA
jgi:hypothetical protein